MRVEHTDMDRNTVPEIQVVTLGDMIVNMTKKRILDNRLTCHYQVDN